MFIQILRFEFFFLFFWVFFSLFFFTSLHFLLPLETFSYFPIKGSKKSNIEKKLATSRNDIELEGNNNNNGK